MAGFIFAWLVFATFLLSERLAKDNRNKKTASSVYTLAILFTRYFNEVFELLRMEEN